MNSSMKKLLKPLASLAAATGKNSTRMICPFFFYQPEEPQALRDLCDEKNNVKDGGYHDSDF